jgi:spore maturation protein CgeB
MTDATVLIIGHTAEGSLEQSYARALPRLGCRVHFWDPEAALHSVSKGLAAGRLFATFVHVEPWLRTANLRMLQHALAVRPNLILLVGTFGVRGGTLAQIRVLLPTCVIYCLYPDSPHHLDDDRIHCLPFCDRVLTSSPAWQSAFQRLGAPRVEYLPFAADTDLHHPDSTDRVDPTLSHDVTFIGTWRREREEILEGLTDFDLCLWGDKSWRSRTRRGSPLIAHWGGRPVYGSEFSSVCANSRILINIMDPPTWPGPNMRTFEQAACRAFSLTTRSPAVLDLFVEGETIECFDGVEEARGKIRHYLEHPTDRERIAQAGYRLVVEGGHTYVDRARCLLEWSSQDRDQS